jgi:hypothetical protein
MKKAILVYTVLVALFFAFIISAFLLFASILEEPTVRKFRTLHEDVELNKTEKYEPVPENLEFQQAIINQ